MIEFFFTMPISSRMPMMLKVLSVKPPIHNEIAAPAIASGSTVSTVIGCRNDSNCAARMR